MDVIISDKEKWQYITNVNRNLVEYRLWTKKNDIWETDSIYGRFLICTEKFWFTRSPFDIAVNVLGINTTKQRIKELCEWADNLEIFTYLSYAHDGTDECIKILQNTVAEYFKENRLVYDNLWSILPPKFLKKYVEFIKCGKIQKQFGKQFLKYVMEDQYKLFFIDCIEEYYEDIINKYFAFIKINISDIVDKIIFDNSEIIEQIKAGNKRAIGSLVGKAIGIDKNVNPKEFTELLLKKIVDMGAG